MKLGSAVGRAPLGMFWSDRLSGFEGIRDGMKIHSVRTRITRINPIGRRKLRGWFRREKIRRLGIDIGLPLILHRNEGKDETP